MKSELLVGISVLDPAHAGDARIRCVRGVEHRYTDQQLAFHMAASMPAGRP